MCQPTTLIANRSSSKPSRRSSSKSLRRDSATEDDESASNELLRLCSNLNFEPIQKHCSKLLRKLSKGNATEAEQANMAQELLTTDNWGNTPLHVICFHKPPVRLVQKMLELSDKLSLALPSITNDRGATPLHTVCMSGGTLEVVFALLKAGSDISTCDSRGMSPISAICRRHALFQMVQSVREDHAARQLSASNRSDRDEQEEGSEQTPAVAVADKYRVTSGMDSSNFEGALDAILEAGWENEVETNVTFSRQRAVAYFCNLVPLELTNQMLSKESLSAEEVSTLLFLAVSRPWVPQTGSDSKAINATLLQQQAHFIQQLLLKLSSTGLKGTTTRSIFAQATASGLPWSIEESAAAGPLQILFEACPDATVHSKDSVTGLYPFQLSACNCEDLNTVYTLLRIAPEAIRLD